MTWERIADRVSAYGLVFVLGWLSSTSYYNLNHLWAQRNQLAQTAAQAVCDRGRAREAAGALIAADDMDDVAIDAKRALKGCPKVDPARIAPVAKILKSK